MEGLIGKIVHELLDQVEGREALDLIEDFAFPFGEDKDSHSHELERWVLLTPGNKERYTYESEYVYLIE